MLQKICFESFLNPLSWLTEEDFVCMPVESNGSCSAEKKKVEKRSFPAGAGICLAFIVFAGYVLKPQVAGSGFGKTFVGIQTTVYFAKAFRKKYP